MPPLQCFSTFPEQTHKHQSISSGGFPLRIGHRYGTLEKEKCRLDFGGGKRGKHKWVLLIITAPEMRRW